MTCVLHFRHILLRDLEDNLSGLSFYLLRRELDIYRYIVLIHDHHLDRHIERHLVRNLSIDPRASVLENIVYEILIKSVLDPLDGYGAKFRCRSQRKIYRITSLTQGIRRSVRPLFAIGGQRQMYFLRNNLYDSR